MSQDLAVCGIKVDATGAILQTQTLGASLDTLASKGEAAITTLKGAFLGLAGVAAAGFLGREFLKNTEEAQHAMAQLAAAVKSTGGAAQRSVEQLDAYSMSLQQMTTFSDEAVKGAQSMLLTFDKIKGANFDRATAAITDLATRMGGDLQGAAIQVGKALQDPATGLTALRRSGVSFSESQVEVIKNLYDTGRAAEGQVVILKELEHQFGGSAAAARGTLGGALKGLSNDFGDLFEQTSENTKGLVSFINATGLAIRSVHEYSEEVKLLAIALGTVGTALVTVKAGTLAFTAGAAAFSVVAPHIFSVAAAFAAARVAGTGFTGVLAGLSYTVTGAVAVFAPLALAVAGVAAAYVIYQNELAKVAEKEDDAIKNTKEYVAYLKALGVAHSQAGGAGQLQTKVIDDQTAAIGKLTAAGDAELAKLTALNNAYGQSSDSLKRLEIEYDRRAERAKNAVDHTAAETAALNRLTDAMAAQKVRALDQANNARNAAANMQAVVDAANAAAGAFYRARDAQQVLDDQIRSSVAVMQAAIKAKFDAVTEAGKKVTDVTTSAAERGARETQRFLTSTFSTFFTDLLSNGKNAFESLWGAAKSGFIKLLADMAALKLTRNLLGAEAGASASAANPIAAAASGNPYVVGAAILVTAGSILVGAANALNASSVEQEAAAKALRESARAQVAAVAQSVSSYIATSNGDTVTGRLAQAEDEFQELFKKLRATGAVQGGEEEEALFGARNRKRQAILDDEAEAEAKRIQENARQEEDAALRLAKARGDENVEKLIRDAQERREIEDLVSKGASAATIELTKLAQAAEDAAVATANAAAAQAKAAEQARAVEDINVELLNAKGETGAAADLQFQLEQQRRLEDAQKNQSGDYVKKLIELQQLQRDSRAAQGLIDSTTGPSAGGGGGGRTGATSALSAVQATVTERTAYMLVDVGRSQLSVQRQMLAELQRLNHGGGRSMSYIEEELGSGTLRASLYSGSVSR